MANLTGERIERAAEGMRRAGYAALIVREPEHVLMLSGYQPILGNSFLLLSLGASGNPEVRLAALDSEVERASEAQPVQMETFTEETLSWIGDTIVAVKEPLGKLLASAGIAPDAVVGIEGGTHPIATGYTQVGTPAFATIEMLRGLLPQATLRDATDLLDELKAVKSEAELERIRQAERVAIAGFRAAREAARPGVSEADVAAETYAALVRAAYGEAGVWNAQPFVHVMAGRRSYLAYLAYNMTSSAVIQPGDPVLVQLEIGLDGYWAELSRTFFAGSVSETWRAAHAACVRAQDAALKAIRPGVAARDVDAAARDVMKAADYGEAFKHGLGHGFGFQAINHGARPILHPASTDTLRAGMVSNLEPAVYLRDIGGLRLNDDVAVRPDGCELLSRDLPRDLEWMITPE
ncbi:MAG TPA: Xaa-Pro peptidase family protein [Ktedonobacterales bacterium]|nr:Xaa-Pro peptidase family protein [Ktedonobacterales bacterium]